MQGGGWRAWVVNNAKASRPYKARNEIDRLRAELRVDFRSALRHAYLGPRYALQFLLSHSASRRSGLWKMSFKAFSRLNFVYL